MKPELHKFPSTPHFLWLGKQPVRDDKVLTPQEQSDFLGNDLVVEEKIDGANLGISFDEDGHIGFQNRGNWLEGKLTGQWERLRGWAAGHEDSLRTRLPKDHVLFGEWCYAKHSILYDSLPDWFVAFDVYDRNANRFWSVARRNALLEDTGIASVPQVANDHFTSKELAELLNGQSSFSHEPREGIYLRLEKDGWLTSRAKIVRPEFVQQIADHWSSRSIEPNHLCPEKSTWEKPPTGESSILSSNNPRK